MKNLTKIPATLTLLAILSLCSCKKDKSSPKNEVETIPNFEAIASANVLRPCGIAVSPLGKIAVSEYKEGYGLSGTTKVWNSYGDLMANKQPAQSWQNVAAEALAFDNQENLYVVETEQTAALKVYKNTGQSGAINYQLARTDAPGFNNPRGIAFDSNNRLYLADDGNDRLLRYNNPATSASFVIVAGGFGGLKGLAIYNDSLMVTSYNRNIIYKNPLTPAGALANTFQTSVTHPVDVAYYNNLIAIGSPDESKITLINGRQFNVSEGTYSGDKKELTSTGAIYGLAFVKMTNGKVGLLAALYNQNKIVLYQPK